MTLNTSPDALLADLQNVIESGDRALKAAAGVKTSEAENLRVRVQARISEARADLAQIQELTVQKAKAAGRVTDEFVHVNPWKSVGIGAAVGLLVGVLAARR